MIRSVACRETEQVFLRQRSRKFQAIARVAQKKLEVLHAAEALEDLLVPPGNRLEALRGDRRGQHSIRVNDQWRIVFSWREGAPHEVEIVDYH